jgi:hypothetical protein
MKRLLGPIPLALLALFPIAGCGTSSSGSPTLTPNTSPSITYDPADAHLPACARAGEAIALPKNLPVSFPIPPGSAITGQRVPIGGGIAGTGFIPRTSFASAVHYIPNHLAARGFKLLHLEIDAPNDSEGSYQGHGYVGGWSLRSIAGCAGAMVFQVSAKKQ